MGDVNGGGFETGTYIITVTTWYLAPDASACSSTLYQTNCNPSPTLSLGTPAITTRYFVPLVVQNPSSCTKTSFSYTSSTTVNPRNPPGSLYLQAAESAEAVFVTTYVVTLSTDLGGQPVTTTYVDAYLSSGAVLSLTPVDPIASYLSECVDPSSYLCSASYTVTEYLGCTFGPTTYSPTAPSTGGSLVPSTNSASNPATTSSWNGGESVTKLLDVRSALVAAGLGALYLI